MPNKLNISNAILLLFLPPILLLGQQNQPLKIESIFETKYINGLSISPKGNKIAFTIGEANLNANKYLTNIWVKDLNTETPPIKISSVDGNYNSLSWSPDEKNIFFLNTQSSNGSQVYSIPAAGGVQLQLTNYPTSVQRYSVTNDLSKIYYIAEDTLTSDEKKLIADKWDTYFFEENRKYNSLYELDVKSKRRNKLTFGFNIRSFSISPSGNQIALTATTTANMSDEQTTEIYLYNIQSKTIKRLTRNTIIERQIMWWNDENIYFTAAANEKLEFYYQESIFRLNTNSEQPIDFLPGFRFQVLKYDLDIKNGLLYFIANKGLTQQLFSLKPSTSEISELTNFKGVVKDFSFNTATSRLTIQITDPNIPDQIQIRTATSFRKIYDPNPSIKQESIPLYHGIEWISNDGTKIQGLLITPKNLDRRKKYPVIVQLHGGPNSSYQFNYGNWWATYPQILVSMGYMVFQPNYRGSTGYGDDFMRGIIGDFFTLGSEDILSGIEFLSSAGLIDSDRIGLMGYSAGAHFANWLITQTDRFKFAISTSGMANWLSFYAQNEVPYLREVWLKTVPYNDLNFWMASSPITYAANIKTPTLFSHGELDKRVPLAQSIEMWRALKRNSIPTRLMIFPREFHSIDELKHQQIKMKEELDWIKKFLPN